MEKFPVKFILQKMDVGLVSEAVLLDCWKVQRSFQSIQQILSFLLLFSLYLWKDGSYGRKVNRRAIVPNEIRI